MESEHTQYRVILSGFFAGIIGALLILIIAQQIAPSEITTEDTVYGSREESLVVDVIKRSSPAVVSIVISKDVPVARPGFNDFFYDPFYFYQNALPESGPTRNMEIGGGSGFFVSGDGLIVTNRHVVDDEKATYTVYTNGGESYDATVVARDSSLDIALMRVSGINFPYLRFADSDKLRVGQTAIAIGNALAEFRNTVSVGVVSGLLRSIVAGAEIGEPERLDEVIQTDAAINPGNSGGPLLDLSGKVIGMNVAVVEGSENIGFALPSNAVRDVVESVQKNGRIVHPFLGVRYIPVTKTVVDQEKLAIDYGVLVVSGENGEPAVLPGSPAYAAGVIEGDVIIEFNGKKLSDGISLASEIRRSKVGAKVRLVIFRDGSRRTVNAVLAESK